MYDAMSRGAPAPLTHIDLTFYMARLYEEWCEHESEADQISAADRSQLKKTASTAYYAVYTGMRDSQSPLVLGADNVNKSFNVWIESAATWRWFGDKACLCNNFVLGAQIYEQGLLRDKTLAGKSLRSVLCFATAKCKARFGDIKNAKFWLLQALEGTDEYANDASAKDFTQMQAILEAWDNPTTKFSEDMALPIPKLLAGHALISPSAATTPTGTPRTMRGDDLTPRGNIDAMLRTPVSAAERDGSAIRWGKIRRCVIDLAVQKLVRELEVAPGSEAAPLARRIAYLKIGTEPAVAAAILQKLHGMKNFGEDAAEFFERLASAHSSSWFEAPGMTSVSRLHLVLAERAWKKALTHLSVASKPRPWALSVAVCTSLGNFEDGASQLGTLIRSFPMNDEPLSVVAMSASVLLAELRQYDQACTYMLDSIEKGPCHPFGEIDMAFFMARLNERWGGGAMAEDAYCKQRKIMETLSPRILESLTAAGQGRTERDDGSEAGTATDLDGASAQNSVESVDNIDESVTIMYDDDNEVVPLPGTAKCEAMKLRRENARASYEKVFRQLKILESEHVDKRKHRLMNADAHQDCASWLKDAKTWLCFGELAVMGSMYVLACDMFGQCIKRDNVSKAMYCHLARAKRHVGSIQESMRLMDVAMSTYAGDLKDKEIVAKLKAENKCIKATLKRWAADESEIASFGEQKGDADGELSKLLRMNLKELVFATVPVIRREEEVVVSAEIQASDSLADEGEGDGQSEKPVRRQLKRKVEPWRVERRDLARSVLWQWLRAGLKNAARKAILRRLGEERGDAASLGRDDIACLGILMTKSSRKDLAGILLHRALDEGFSGCKDSAAENSEAEKKLEEADKKASKTAAATTANPTKTVVGAAEGKTGDGSASFNWSMARLIDEARFMRAVVDCWANLSQDGENRYHCAEWLAHSSRSLECQENAMKPACWMMLIRAQIHSGMFSEAAGSARSFLMLKADSELKSHASILDASLLLKKGTEGSCTLALEGMRRAIELEGEGGRKCGLLRKELTFLYAFVMKRHCDSKHRAGRENNSEGAEPFERVLGGYDGTSLLLFEGVFQEEDALEKVGNRRKKWSVIPTAGSSAEEEAQAPVKEWLLKMKTWQKFAKRCQACGQVVFCFLLHRHAFNLAIADGGGASINDKMKCAKNLVRSYCSIGMFAEADLFVSKEVPAALKDRLRQFLKGYSDESTKKVEADWLEQKRSIVLNSRLAGVDQACKFLYTKPEEMLGKWKNQDAENERRWKVLKVGLRPAARALAIQQVLLNNSDATQIAMLGLLCTSENVKDSGTQRCACLLLQAAADLGYKGSPIFWKKLARCHLSMWHGAGYGRGGVGGERGHLIKVSFRYCSFLVNASTSSPSSFFLHLLRLSYLTLASQADFAFGEALKCIENATDISVWISAAEAKLCLGQYSNAAMCLGNLLRQLGGGIMERRLPEMGKVCLTVVELLVELKKFDQAEAYLYDAMVRGAESPLGQVDLLFYMARLHEKWSDHLLEDVGGAGVEAAARQHLETSQAAYARVFRQCSELPGEDGSFYGVKGDTMSPEDWLSNWASWCCFAERAALARHYLTAADLYREGLRRDDATSTSRSQPWFSLAKAFRRCGRLNDSLSAARRAVEIYRERSLDGRASGKGEVTDGGSGKGGGDGGGLSAGQMKIAIKAWEEDELGNGTFEKELGMGVAHWIDVYLSSGGESGEFSVAGAQLGSTGGMGTGKVTRRKTVGGRSEGEESGSDIWIRLRRGVVTAALKVDCEDLLQIMSNENESHTLEERVVAERYARLGLLCASHRHVSVDLARLGARFIEMAIVGKLFELGEAQSAAAAAAAADNEGSEGADRSISSGRKALIWRRLAECHAVVAYGDGLGREEDRWRESRDAWKEALTFLECATDQHCWESDIFVSINLGDHSDACKTLGILLRSFKARGIAEGSAHSAAGHHRSGSYNRLLAASLLMKLSKFEQAHSYITTIMEVDNKLAKKGGAEGPDGDDNRRMKLPAPLTHMHLIFAASRCYELWGGRGGGAGAKKVGEAGYRRCYGLILEENAVSPREGAARLKERRVRRAGGALERGVGNAHNVEQWLSTPETWHNFAMDFHYAGLDLFANDFFGAAVKIVSIEKAKEAAGNDGEGNEEAKNEEGGLAAPPSPNPSLDFWLDAANVALKAGNLHEATRMCQAAVDNYPESRRAKKCLKMAKKGSKGGGFDKEGSLKYMRKKGVRELCLLIMESAPVVTLAEKES